MSDDEKHPGTPDGEAKQLSLGIANFIETEPAGSASQRLIEVKHGRPAATGSAQAGAELSKTRQRLLREEADPQMVLIRLLEDARWVQGRARLTLREAEKASTQVSVLKLFWAVRTELVKMLQGLGVLPRELFFEDEETNFDDVPAEVAETISGLLSGRIEPH